MGKKYVGYYRVSTKKQGQSGLGLQAQRKAIAEYIRANGGELVAEHKEIESGKRSDRPELAEALQCCKRNRATLLIGRLDRLARNLHFITGLMESGADFIAVDLPHANKLTVHIMSAMAEFERDLISSRTRAAMQAAKDRGVKFGNPTNLSEAQANGGAATAAEADRFAGNVLPLIEQIRASGIESLAGLARALNARGVATARGGRWYPATVRNVMQRAA